MSPPELQEFARQFASLTTEERREVVRMASDPFRAAVDRLDAATASQIGDFADLVADLANFDVEFGSLSNKEQYSTLISVSFAMEDRPKCPRVQRAVIDLMALYVRVPWLKIEIASLIGKIHAKASELLRAQEQAAAATTNTDH